MIKPIHIGCGERHAEFLMDLDPGNVADSSIAWYLQKGVPCEPEVVHLMARVVQPGDFVVDAGANVGFFTLLLSQYVGPTGAVLAIEPGANNLPKLQANIELNRPLMNIQLCEQPLAAKSGPVSFHLAHDSGINACWPSETTTVASQELQATTLDAICEGQPKLVKLDIEGSEMEALKGAVNMLARLTRKPPFVVLELNESALQAMRTTPQTVRVFMDTFGYQMFVLSEHGLLPAAVPRLSDIKVTRNNTNVLFSTLHAVSKAWPEVTV